MSTAMSEPEPTDHEWCIQFIGTLADPNTRYAKQAIEVLVEKLAAARAEERQAFAKIADAAAEEAERRLQEQVANQDTVRTVGECYAKAEALAIAAKARGLG